MNELVLVSGLGRCGLSLMMQMLDAGGLPVWSPNRAKWPDYELGENTHENYVPQGATGLMKWVDPTRFAPPRWVKRTVYLTRNAHQQAKSMSKLIGGGPAFARRDLQALANGIRRDNKRAIAAAAARGAVLPVSFADLIGNPTEVLRRVEVFIGAPIDIDRAQLALRHRETGEKCLPYLLEQVLMRELSLGVVPAQFAGGAS